MMPPFEALASIMQLCYVFFIIERRNIAAHACRKLSKWDEALSLKWYCESAIPCSLNLKVLPCIRTLHARKPLRTSLP
jgi:hypothetical protein